MTRDDARDLRRWLICGVVVLCAHGAVAGWLTHLSEAMPSGAPPEAIIVDLSPPAEIPAETPLMDVPEGPKQEENTPPPEPPVEQQVVEQIPEAPQPEVAMVAPPPEPPPPPEPIKEPPPPEVKPKPKKPPAPKTTAPRPQTRVAALPPHPGIPSPTANPAARASWNSLIASQIERHKRYPADSQSRGDQGVTRVSFALDRNGRVLSASIAGGSGFSALDQESLATIRRAAPFPPPPSDVAGSTFNFTVPIRYKK